MSQRPREPVRMASPRPVAKGPRPQAARAPLRPEGASETPIDSIGSRKSLDASASPAWWRRAVVPSFSAIVLGGLALAWVAVPMSGFAGPNAGAGPAPTQLASVAAPVETRAAAAPEWPRAPADPLDLTPERMRLMEQAGELLRRAKEREERLQLRERVLDAARAELERKVTMLERDTASGRAQYRQEIEKELAERVRQVEAREKQLKEMEETIARVQDQMKKEVGQQFDQIVGSYLGLKPKRAARILEERGAGEAAMVLFLMPEDARVRILGEMDPALVAAVLKTPFADRLQPQRAAAARP
jgi:flagellar motility protein MotE (MotC chaperone)